MDREVRQSRSSNSAGTLSTSLPEDVFSIVDVQATLLRDYIKKTRIVDTDVGDAVLIDGLLSIIRTLWHKQTHYRNIFLTNLECCVASANDFLRMINKVDELMYNVSRKYPHLLWNERASSKNGSGKNSKRGGRSSSRASNLTGIKSSNTNSEIWAATSLLRKEAADLICLYGGDAVHSAQKASTYIVSTIHKSDIKDRLFSRDWEDK